MSSMATTKILVVRHAEKPDGHGTGGVDPSGQPDPKSLTPRGWQRAGALVQLFAPRTADPQAPLMRPDHLFAARAGHEEDEHSKRPYQTIEPLAAYLQISGGIDSSFRKDELDKLVNAVISCDGTVLIAWEHKNIPPMARILVPPSEQVPDWPDDRYDMIWVFDRVGDVWHLTQVPQRLLAGDIEAVFA
ncbi:histidine phosphatase family protein [Agrobacterium deltaense]|nr:histidine phosphatase family protein [Agrobacterium deltaense]